MILELNIYEWVAVIALAIGIIGLIFAIWYTKIRAKKEEIDETPEKMTGRVKSVITHDGVTTISEYGVENVFYPIKRKKRDKI